MCALYTYSVPHMLLAMLSSMWSVVSSGDVGWLEIELSLALSCALQPFFAFNTISGSCKLLQAYLTPVLSSVVAGPFISYCVCSC